MFRRRLIRYGEAVVLIGLGGMLGANLRFLVGASAGDALATTLAVNAVGSFALGLLLFDGRTDDLLSKRSRYVFGTGFCASFTTYSTFVADIATSSPGIGIAYIVGSYAAGFGAVLLSRAVIDALGARPVGPPVPEGE